MNNQGEIYKALVEGKIMECKVADLRVHLVEGVLLNEKHKGIEVQAFSCPSNWSIYTKPKWYENIPIGGVLCKYKNGSTYETVAIFGYKEGMFRFRKKTGGFDEEMIPLTKAEIQEFADNAPC